MGASALELRIPPLALTALFGAAMYASRWVASGATAGGPWVGALAVVIALAGAAVMVLGVVEFRRAGTTVDPTRPEGASDVVIGGVYRYTRNPMYLGMAALLLAWAVWLGALVGLVWVPLFVAYMNRFQIEPEERMLRKKFGARFEAYVEQVRRWL